VDPLVSIIIPVYNSEKYLAQAINSVQRQTWGNIELIVVDDGSTDNSLKIAMNYVNDTVKVIRQRNSGSASARNRGLAEAQGKYIQFLDADDVLSDNKIAEQVFLLEKSPGKIAVCSTVHFFEEENYLEGVPSDYENSFLIPADPVHFLTNLLGGYQNKGSMIQTNAWLCPAAVLREAGPWSEFYSPDDDGEYFCRVILASKGVIVSNNCFNYYRKYRHHHSLAAQKNREALQGKFKSFLLKKQFLLQASQEKAAMKALANSAMPLALEAYLVDKQLTGQILAEIKELGGTDYVPVLGGSIIETIKHIFGWKTARRLQYYARLFRIKFIHTQ